LRGSCVGKWQLVTELMWGGSFLWGSHMWGGGSFSQGSHMWGGGSFSQGSHVWGAGSLSPRRSGTGLRVKPAGRSPGAKARLRLCLRFGPCPGLPVTGQGRGRGSQPRVRRRDTKGSSLPMQRFLCNRGRRTMLWAGRQRLCSPSPSTRGAGTRPPQAGPPHLHWCLCFNWTPTREVGNTLISAKR